MRKVFEPLERIPSPQAIRQRLSVEEELVRKLRILLDVSERIAGEKSAHKGNVMLDQIQIEISKAGNGQDYVQIRSPSALPVNIVLVADTISVVDMRDQPAEKSAENSAEKSPQKSAKKPKAKG